MANVRAARKDPARFAAEVRGERLAGWQEADVRAAPSSPINCWTWTRQSGKSVCLALLALWVAFRVPGKLALIISGGGDLGARRLLSMARQITVASPLLRDSVVDESGSLLTLSNGSQVRSVPASEFAVRGWSVDALLCDECHLIGDDLLLGAALPTVAARPEAFVVLAGTASRAEGAFFDLWRRGELGEEGIRFSRRVSKLVGGPDDAPWQSPTIMAQLERSMGPLRANAELRCIPAAGADYLFTRQDIDAITADFAEDPLGAIHGPAGVGAGLDLGVRRDRSAVVALGRLVVPDVDFPVFGVRCAHAWPSGYDLMAPAGGATGVFEELAASPMVAQWLRVDVTGMQSGFMPYLVPLMRARPQALGGGPRPARAMLVNPFVPDPWGSAQRQAQRRSSVPATDVGGVTFTSAMKQAAYGALRALVERRQLVIPASASELRAELMTLRTELGRSGQERFDAQSGGFDDLPDALVLALKPFQRHDGVWHTAVGDLAEQPLTPWPDMWTGSDVVSSGGGLRMLKTPVWAPLVGHVGRHLTVPAGLQETDPEAERERAEAEAESERQQALRDAVRQRMRDNEHEQEAAHAD